MDDIDWLEPSSNDNKQAVKDNSTHLHVLDTHCEFRFDSLISLALEIVGGINCAVSLVAGYPKHYKPTATINSLNTNDHACLSAWLVNNALSVLLVNDITQDDRFAQLPRTDGDMAIASSIASYLGVALHDNDGMVVGSLYIVDEVPREFTPAHIQHLTAIAKRVEIELQQANTIEPSHHLPQSVAASDLYDPITTLPNKQHFVKTLKHHLKIQHIHGQYGQIAVIQIQRLRHIARIYRDVFCRQVLVEFSHRISTSLPNDAFIAKLSTDKFIVFLPAIFAQSQVDYFAHVKEILEKPILHKGTSIYINSQVGLTFITDHNVPLEAHISRCLFAMQNSDSQHSSYPSMEEDYERLTLRAMEIENHLHRAINQNAFTMVYQPIVEAYSETMVAVEALVRWRWKPNEFLPPAEFIPIAEAAGIMLPLSQWILKTACIEFAALQKELPSLLYLSINISPAELMSKDFVEQVINACDLASLSYDLIQLEITEHALLADYDGAVKQLSLLHGLGVRIAIDDFGTGHSSLQYLHKLPVDVVKIDRSFICDIHQSPESNAIVKAIIALSHELGKLITAEGIETFEQAEFLRQEKINTGQGWYYGKPMDIKTLLIKTTELTFL